ncbi:glycoside hydrolase family 172 protein [Paenibacillus thermotolerans]|uniref:glycoside hydrolase family 172 protein n=1 Tax=Paenibacillus thermotolerans TaxID=3027807 RepID=UPI0023680AC9|nr:MULTISPECIES: glycoside hydrolase family 172 protein [unclassified Paenibacillus]
MKHGYPQHLAEFRDSETRQMTTFNLANKSKTIRIPRGEKLTIGEVHGQGCITQLWLTFPGWFWQHWNPKAPISQTILKTLILRIYWDGEPLPAVQAPVGDFFGNGLCEISSFTSQYFGMSSGGFFARFPMPFVKGFRIELENRDSLIDTDVFCNVLYQLSDAPLPNAGYFHAQFNTGRNSGPEPVMILEASGRGHFVGCSLSMQGEEQTYLSFLEAPEYVYIDADWETPRIVGTGLEDYFLGGWYFREGEFTGPLHGVPSKDTLNASVAMYRLHEADAISFKERIRFQFVNPWSPDRLKPFAYSSVAFYYSDSPSDTRREIPSVDELLCWYRVKNTDRLSVP